MTTPEPWPDLAGRLIGGGHVLPVRIYFEDTDFSGVVYHGSYIRFMERGRSDFVRLLGVGHDALDAGEHGEPLAFAVRRMTIEFLKPARIDDLLEVETRVERNRRRAHRPRQTVRRGGEVLVDGGGDGRPRQPRRAGRGACPDSVRDGLLGGGGDLTLR